MEKRALLAIALSVGILLAWQALFAPPAPPPAPAPGPLPTEGRSAAAGSPPSGGAEIPIAMAQVPQGGPPEAGRVAAEVATPLYRITFGTAGAVTGWTLHYRGDKPVVVESALAPLAVSISRPGLRPEIVQLRPDVAKLELTATQPTGSLSFSGVTSDGLRIQKGLRFGADSHLIDVQLRVEGISHGPVALAVYWTTPVAKVGSNRDAPWLTIGEGAKHEQLLGRILVAQEGGHITAFEAPTPALKDPKGSPGELKDPALVESKLVPGDRAWVGLENDYFLAALVPASDGVQLLRGRERELAQIAIVFPDVRVEPGRAWEGQARLYVGPKEWDRLTTARVGLEEAQARNYGHFLWLPWVPMWWFTVPLLWLMNFFGTQVPGQNYGVAIILLTVLVKVLFYPLTHKSMSSMKRMQALQPQVNAIRSKYRSDNQRLQREQMELYRRAGVNPMGGCLPMIVQIPIFYALYLTLQYSVELQGAPFLLWISDLSKKDSYYVLPILMGVSMLWQQKMTPTVGDPRQAKIMLIMPVIFTFMFLEFPTGLVLYWLVNNMLSIAQQYLIDRTARLAKVAVVDGKVEKETRKA